MEEKQGTETKETQSKSKLLVAAIVILCVIIVAAVIVIVKLLNKPETTEAARVIGTEVGIITNEDDAANIELNEPFSFTTLYKRDIYVTNGREATCYIGNSDANYYEDMYIQIYLNDENDNMSEELYVSQIIPRGSHIESFTMERDLEPGDYRGTLIHSCVDEDGNLAGDTPVIVDIHVSD